MEKFFPFTLRHASSFGGIAFSFQALFLANKPKDLSWYAADVIINSPTQVEFVVFGMACSLYGGTGAEIARFHIPVSPAVTAEAMENRSYALSRLLVEREERHKRDKRVEAGAKALLAEALKTP